MPIDRTDWDANRAMGAASSASDYRQICAGEKTTGEVDERQHWALPHHYLGRGPNANGVRAARGRFDQTQDLKNRDAARSHLDAHAAEIERATQSMVVASFPTTLARQEARGRTMVGYAAAYGVPVTDAGGWFPAERMFLQASTFKKSLKENWDKIKVLFNHGKDPQIGQKPLGKPAVMRSDDYGLWTETPLDKTSWNDDIIESLRSGALDSMSVTMEALDYEFSEDGNDLHVTQARLWEFGPVTFPANPGATAQLHSLAAFDGIGSDGQGQAESPSEGGRLAPPPTLASLTFHIQVVTELEEARSFLEAQRERQALIKGG